MGIVYLRCIIIFLLNCRHELLTAATKNEPKIIIIGAGAAGITAATSLVDYGFKNVTILEMKERIGGRVYTKQFGESIVDIGAAWLCTKKGSFLDELATKHNLFQKQFNKLKNYTVARSNAEIVPASIWQRLRNITFDIEKIKREEISNFNGSLGAYLKKKFDEKLALTKNADIDKIIAQEYYDTYDKKVSSDKGTDSLDVVSAQDFSLFQTCEGNKYIDWKEYGSIELFNLLMDTHNTGKQLGKLDGKLKFSNAVMKIHWQRDDKKAIVQTSTNEQYEADHVIITVSLGVLKSNLNNLFEPILPLKKINAIKSLGYNGVNKLFLDFDKAFWPTDWQGIYLLWREEDLKQIRNTKYSWLEDIYGFETVADQPTVLMTWVIGSGGRQMENLSKYDIKIGCLYLLNKFLPAQEKDIFNIENSAWTSDVGFRGSFSYHSVETKNANLDNKHLAEPLTLDDDDKPILLFAGEATEHVHYGTVQGAIESGQREADRIRDYYKEAV